MKLPTDLYELALLRAQLEQRICKGLDVMNERAKNAGWDSPALVELFQSWSLLDLGMQQVVNAEADYLHRLLRGEKQLCSKRFVFFVRDDECDCLGYYPRLAFAGVQGYFPAANGCWENSWQGVQDLARYLNQRLGVDVKEATRIMLEACGEPVPDEFKEPEIEIELELEEAA